ncbi:hypothetical protein IQ255_15730 [Pleurocapsales cyanobacterium LEGE 10410]|nr:hypothetical protein [Pleurocapsales cyanobacterium LEGE 10410]
MQHQDFPLFILLLTSIYLGIIYGILKIAEELNQEESFLRKLSSDRIKDSIAYIAALIVEFPSKWLYNPFKDDSYQQKKFS